MNHPGTENTEKKAQNEENVQEKAGEGITIPTKCRDSLADR
jgi:hypothetical protein